jgi:hypothetical protein
VRGDAVSPNDLVLRAVKVLYGGFSNWDVRAVRSLEVGTPPGGLTAEVLIISDEGRLLRLEGTWDGTEWVDRVLSETKADELREDAKKGGKKKGRTQPKCTKGRPCGGSCVRMKTASGKDTQCRNKPEGAVKEALNKAAGVKSAEPKAPAKSQNTGSGAPSNSGSAANATPKNVINFEKDILDLPREKAGLFKQGRKLFETNGGVTSVTFNQGQLAKMAGGILTHNHPTSKDSSLGLSLSPADIVLAVSNRLSEIRAVSGEYVYSLRVNGVEDSPEFRRFVQSTEGRVSKKLRKKLDSQIKPTTTDDELLSLLSTVNFESSHEIASSIASKYGMTYERQKLPA